MTAGTTRLCVGVIAVAVAAAALPTRAAAPETPPTAHAAVRDGAGRWQLVDDLTPQPPAAERPTLEAVNAWVWSATVPPRRVEPARWRDELGAVARGEAKPRVEALAVHLRPSCAPRCEDLAVVAAPAAMWEEVDEAWLPAWPVARSGRVSIPRTPGERWRLRLVGKGRGGWWLDVEPRERTVVVAPTPATDLRLLVTAGAGEPVERFAVTAIVDEPTGFQHSAYAQFRSQGGEEVVVPSLPGDRRAVFLASAPEHVTRILAGRPPEVPYPIRLPAGATVEGRLVDGQHRPIAEVELLAEGWLSAESPVTAMARATSDEAGRWHVGPLPAGRVVVRAAKPGWQTHLRELELEPGEKLDLGLVELAPGQELAVTVVDSNGDPVPGATVTHRAALARRTDEAGETVIDGLAQDRPVELRVEAADFLPAVARIDPPWPHPAVVELRQGLRVSGFYTNSEGVPVEGGSIRIETGSSFRNDDLGPGGALDLVLETDSEHTLVLSSADTAATRVRVEPGVPGEHRDLGAIRAAPGLVVHGRLVAAETGLPVAGARIWTPRTTEHGTVAAWAFGDVVEAASDGGGDFQLAGLARKPHEVIVEATGFARRYVEVRPPEGAAAADLGVLELSPGATVAVDLQALDDGEEATLDARLDLQGRWREQDMLRAAVVDGMAEFVRVPAGESLLTVLSGREIVCEKRVRVPDGGEVEVACDEGRRQVAGVVLLGERPAGPGTLTWEPPEVDGPDGAAIFNRDSLLGVRQQRAVGIGRPAVQVDVAGDGSFASDRLGAGRWQVVWQPAGGDRFAPREVDVPAGGIANLVLRFSGSVVAGHVVDEDGEPVAGALVRAIEGSSTVLSGEDGTFRLAGVEGSSIRLQAQARERLSPLVEVALDGRRPVEDVELVVRERHDGRIAVQVWSDTGAPGGGALVFAEGEQAGAVRVLSADRDGRAEITFREPHPRQVRVAAYLEGRWALGDWVSWEEAQEGLAATVAETGSLTLLVEDQSAAADLTSANGWSLGRMLALVGARPRVTPERPFSFGGLPPGLYSVRMLDRERTVMVAEGEERTLRME